jgi:hypothetical protein
MIPALAPAFHRLKPEVQRRFGQTGAARAG